ncbi:MAG: hypothetical protein ACT4PM_09795 [Gemmatimonadales bacterium]
MALAHEYLDRLLEGTSPGAYHWHHVLGMLHAISADRSDDSEAALRRAATFAGRVIVDPAMGFPHAMSPEDMIRSFAVQTLGERNQDRHRDVIERAHDLAESEHLRAIARAYLAT